MSGATQPGSQSVEAVKAFGPTALATPANAVTLARLVAAPLFAIYVVQNGPTSWLLWVLWTVLALSDGLDGRIARWHGTTRSGAFLDPLADKFLVIGALCALCALGDVSIYALTLIAAREIAMSIYRVLAARDGLSIPAGRLAKFKTLTQDVAIGIIFLPLIGQHHLVIAQSLLWVAVALTVVSGAQYFVEGRRLSAERHQPASNVADKSKVA
ncbi:MAG TPA: CDP-diacylglycerol--glycerol-3-phosphate 3-phosphatidyltransferase [Acidimicrobiales bacterium]